MIDFSLEWKLPTNTTKLRDTYLPLKQSAEPSYNQEYYCYN